jgi:hypothetical protein
VNPGSVWFFVDESGSPDLVNRYGKDLLSAGETSKYLVLAAVRIEDPKPLRLAMQSCVSWADERYGTGIGRTAVTGLHACDDRPPVRTQVLTALCGLPLTAITIAMDKRLMRPDSEWRTDRVRFYNEMAALLLADQLHLYQDTRIIFSHKNHDTRIDFQAMIKVIGNRWGLVTLRSGLAPSPSVRATNTRCRDDAGLYAADYFAWSVFRAFESGDLRYVKRLKPVLGQVWDLARLRHHNRRRPMENPPDAS